MLYQVLVAVFLLAVPNQAAPTFDLQQQVNVQQEGPKYRDCLEMKAKDPNVASGVYTIFHSPSSTGLRVYCDMETEGGGWIVFQKRKDGSVDFERSYNEYVNGFGSFKGEFWLGLEHLYELTANGTHDMRVEIEDFDGNKFYELYPGFYEEKGKLESTPVYRSYFHSYGYTGTAGDGLSHYLFYSTELDAFYPEVVCKPVSGGWWGGASMFGRCDSTNLNGRYVTPETDDVKGAMTWTGAGLQPLLIAKSQMKIRRANSE